MAANLLRQGWGRLDPRELRIILNNRIRGAGQFDGPNANPCRFYLPLAGAGCRVVLHYCDRHIASVEPGHAFDQAQWDAIAEEIETSVLTGPVKVGRDYSFCSYRVNGSWRGARSGVQILPPSPESPVAPVEMAEHPFILEFPIRETKLWPLTNYRRQREHRSLTLLLNVLLAGRVNLQPRRAPHFWGMSFDPAQETRWVQNSYCGKLGKVVQDALSPPADSPLPEVAACRYFTEVRGIDGEGLRLPDDLDESICRYQGLAPQHKEVFDRAAYWLDMASRQWHVSTSASFTALVSVIESLINTPGPGNTERFRAFLETYAPGTTQVARRTQMYDLRSGILHGSELMRLDEDLAFGWDPPWWNERELHEELWTVTRVAVRNWLRDPTGAGPQATGPLDCTFHDLGRGRFFQARIRQYRATALDPSGNGYWLWQVWRDERSVGARNACSRCEAELAALESVLQDGQLTAADSQALTAIITQRRLAMQGK